MNDKLKNFMEYVSSNETVKAELQAELKDTEKEAVVSNIIRFAKKHGYTLTEGDIMSTPEELNTEELETVTAGGGGCVCPVVGGGGGGGLICACGIIGRGGVDGRGFPDS